MATTRKLSWPPDVWRRALGATGATQWAVFREKAECDATCAAHPGWRTWAFDLGSAPGGNSHPKAFVAAPEDVFFAAYERVPAVDRHGYEIVRGACRPFFDLECEGDELPRGDGHAVAVAEAALAVMAELAAPLRLSVRIDTIAVDSSHARKFSRHLVVTVSLAETGEAVLLRGPREAGVVAACVAELVGPTSAGVIDFNVYSEQRCMRLLGSSKRSGAHRAPLRWNAARSSLVLATADAPVGALAKVALVAPDAPGHLVLDVPMPQQPARTAAPLTAPPRTKGDRVGSRTKGDLALKKMSSRGLPGSRCYLQRSLSR